MPVSAPSDRRFRRAHVTPARKTRLFRLSWRKAGRAALVLAVVAYVGFRVGRQVLAVGELTISRITGSGNSRLSEGEGVALLAGIRGANLLSSDLDEWRRTLLSSPWLADAAIRRVLP